MFCGAELRAHELGFKELPCRPIEPTEVLLEASSVLQEFTQCVDGGIGNDEHQAGQIAEDQALLLCEFGSEKRAEDVLVEFDRAIEDFFALKGGERLDALQIYVEHVERNRVLDVVGVDEHEPVSKALFDLR